VQTTSAEGTRTQPIDATIILRVIPHVTPNDFIGMKITATKNDADFGTTVNGIPTLTKREVLIHYYFDYESARIWRSEALEMSRHDR
jgi:type II secretory pathway component HofQ